MCGIAGIFYFNNNFVDEYEITNFTDSLAHRGPDSSGIKIFNNKKLGLGHRRLNILDLSKNGSQPMTYLNHRYSISYNGEIFNYLELKKELVSLGYKFKSKTDTEVILAAYDRWKENSFLKFNGMWSFALWDNKLKTLTLSRDRFGEKPLYFRYINKKFSFSSELKSFVNLKDFDDSEFNYEILHNSRNLENNNNNIIKTVHTLQPGTNMIISHEGKIKTQKWWNIHDYIEPLKIKHNEKIDYFADIFTDSCKIRLRSDRKIATSLSGGVDSTVLLKTLQKSSNIEIPSFFVSFQNTIYDETHHINNLKEHFKNNIHQIDVEDLNPSDLGKIILANENLDVPHFGPWLIYNEMKKNDIAVSLDGHGPDEMLGGYDIHMYYAINDEKSDLKKKLMIKTFKETFQVTNFPNIEGYNFNKKNSFKSLVKRNIKKLSPLFFKFLFEKKNELDDIKFNFKELNSTFNKKLYDDFHVKSLPKILSTYDKLSMSNGVEVRSPYLDWRLVSFCFSLLQEDKLTEHENKHILREYMRKILPNSISQRKSKIGFVTPPEKLFNKKMKEFLLDFSKSKQFKYNNFFNSKDIGNKFENIILKENFKPMTWNELPFWKFFQTLILYNGLKK